VIRRLLPAALILALVAAGVAWFLWKLELAPVRAQDAPNVIFEVHPGAPLTRIARELEAQGLVRSARAVEWLARARGLAGELRSGEYVLSPSMAPDEILRKLARGEVATHDVVIPEGLRASEIAERLEERGLVDAEAFLRVVEDPELVASLGLEGDSLEGYLFPETYRFPRGLPPEELAKSFVAEFRRVWRKIEPRARERGLGMREVVTLASIVEKETGVAEERPLIASVFQNRLERRMRLESDPTVIYGIPDFDGNLRRRDLENPDNPYNTYRIAGLPPGPIASPGADALRAVVEPAETDFLYFVSRNDGTHVFSRTYREHTNHVNRFQRRRSARN
jgi:UPF0755 protein